MLTLGASFLFALLTNRVMFIGDGANMPDLFCEPFPQVSWRLPSDFPITKIRRLKPYVAYNRYENLLQKGSFRNSSVPSFVYFYLGYKKNDYAKPFFCEYDEELIQKVPWLILRSDLYFLPSLFLVPSFENELNKLFPEKETVFHHLGRYLFHPSNTVGGLITRYYDTYLAKADEIRGIQIRVGFRQPPSLNQTMACPLQENLLPHINKAKPIIKQSNNPKTKSVLVTSLWANYSESIKMKYWEYGTIRGERISVHQPCHNEIQKSKNQMHDMKALAEIYLLSFSDKIMITGMSTCGYVANSLGGLRPWILFLPYGVYVQNSPCQEASSMEPCFHFSPPFYTCRNASRIDTVFHVPYIQRCEDINSGVKQFDEE